jgi:hypothetical protein
MSSITAICIPPQAFRPLNHISMPDYAWSISHQNLFIEDENELATTFMFQFYIEDYVFNVTIKKNASNTHTMFIYDITETILAIVTVIKESEYSFSSIESLESDKSDEIISKWYLRNVALCKKKSDESDEDGWVTLS